MSKPRVIKDYDKLPPEVIEQIKLVYPLGFAQHLIGFTNAAGERKMGLPFETEEYVYLIRMTPAKAETIIEEDEDFNEEGELKAAAKRRYADKHEDAEFLDEFNANEDNDLGVEDLADQSAEEYDEEF
jgi:hypothetical protein